MKWFRRTIIFIFIISIVLLAFYRSKEINLEGNWITKEIILEGKKNYPDTLAKLFSVAPQVIINSWSKTITIPIDRNNNITAKLQYIGKVNGHYKIRLFSKEKSLNRSFDVFVDTLDSKPESYTVDVKLKSKRTLIYFQKHVIIPPWKPEFPKKGRP